MKRSRKAALLLMAPATVVFLSSCGEPKTEALVFSTVSECIESGLQSQQQCQDDFDNAKALHSQVAPKYASKAECETDFGEGKCEPPKENQNSHGMGGIFMPMMMGYMMGKMMNGGGANAARSPVAAQPLYRARDDARFRTGANVPINGASGAVSVKPSEVKPQMGSLVRRGGFGNHAQRLNSVGG
jgi:uncharacterized protein YgiB involved in biofilm formation